MSKIFRSPVLFFQIICFTSLLLFFGYIPFLPENLLGLKYTTMSWMLMFILCIPFLLYASRNRFPVFLFLPYFIYILIRTMDTPTVEAVQFMIQPMIPVLIGIIASSFTYSDRLIERIAKMFRAFILFEAAIVVIAIFSKGDIPNRASLVMSICVFGSLALGIFFINKNRRYLLYYLVFVLFTAFTVMRMATLLILLIFPFHFANRSLRFKFLSLLIVGLVGMSIFLSSTFQAKMFYTGQGNVTDISWDNPNFNTSGRNSLKTYVEADLKEYPMFGKGPRKDIDLYTFNNIERAILHNDYLLIRHSYGWVGLVLFLGTLFIQVYLLYIKKKQITKRNHFILWTATMTMFIPYFGFMYTDNIYLYGPFFGHFLFALIGIIYSVTSGNNPAITEETIKHDRKPLPFN